MRFSISRGPFSPRSRAHGQNALQEYSTNSGSVAAGEGVSGAEVGGGAARALGTLREKVGQKDLTQGVSVEVGQTQVAVDVTLVVEYPHPLQDVAARARDAVYTAIEDLVGMEVTEVNITITDIHVPSDDADDDADQEPRVA